MTSFVTNNKYSYMDETTIHLLLKCEICKKPFVDPVYIKGDKDKRYCRLCVERFMFRRPTSNVDGLTNNGDDSYQTKLQSIIPVIEQLVLDMLDSLLVRCQKCGETNLKRGELERHENELCPQATVLCDAADLKCEWMGPRDEQDEHVQQCKFEPLRSALEYLFNEQDRLKTQLERLETEIEFLPTTKRVDNIVIS